MRKFLLALVLGVVAAFGLGGTGVAQAASCSGNAAQYLLFSGGSWATNSYNTISCNQGISTIHYIDQLNIGGYDQNVYYYNTNSGYYTQINGNGSGVVNWGQNWGSGCPWTGSPFWYFHRFYYYVTFTDSTVYGPLWSNSSPGTYVQCG